MCATISTIACKITLYHVAQFHTIKSFQIWHDLLMLNMKGDTLSNFGKKNILLSTDEHCGNAFSATAGCDIKTSSKPFCFTVIWPSLLIASKKTHMEGVNQAIH